MQDGNVLRWSAFRPEGEADPEIFHNFRAWYRGLLRHYNVDHVAIEQPLVTSQNSPATFRTYLRLFGLRAIAIQSAHGLGIPVREVHQASWRKCFTGNGRATKDETLALARKLVPDLKSKDAAEAIGVASWLNSVLRTEKLMGTKDAGTRDFDLQRRPVLHGEARHSQG